jgi:hypothetical protein
MVVIGGIIILQQSKMMRLVCRPSRNNLDDTAPTEQSIVETLQGGSMLSSFPSTVLVVVGRMMIMFWRGRVGFCMKTGRRVICLGMLMRVDKIDREIFRLMTLHAYC